MLQSLVILWDRRPNEQRNRLQSLPGNLPRTVDYTEKTPHSASPVSSDLFPLGGQLMLSPL
jgi:hypothetical protein